MTTRKSRTSKTARKDAVIYCRVSTEEQVDNLSLATQEERSLSYCSERAWPVLRIFRDEGKSAKTTDREAFQTMLALCTRETSTIAYVVVYDLSRFTRNMADQTETVKRLAMSGVELRSVCEDTDDSSTGKLMRNIHGALNQYDNDKRSERTRIGMTKAVSLGRFPFRAPVGYINVSAQTGRNLILDPKSAPLIRKAFELAATGLKSKAEILKTVSQLGLQSSKGKLLSAQTFQQILRNPLYAGWVVIPTWGLKMPGNFDPLVEQGLFDKVQDVLDGKKAAVVAHLRNHPDFPLRVFVRCGACDTPLTGSWSKGRNRYYAYYHCRREGCRVVTVKTDVLEAAFIRLMECLTPETTLVQAFTAAVRDVWKQRQGDASEEVRKTKRRLSEERTRKDKLVDAMLDERIDKATYDEQQIRLDAKIDQLRVELAEQESESLDLEGVLAFAGKIVTRPSRLWLESSLDQRQRLQQVTFPKGLTFLNGEFGTGVTSSFFDVLRDVSSCSEGLASPTGFEPVSSP